MTYSIAPSVDYLSLLSLSNSLYFTFHVHLICLLVVFYGNPQQFCHVLQDFFDQSLDEIKLLRLIRFNTAQASAGWGPVPRFLDQWHKATEEFPQRKKYAKIIPCA